MSSDLFRLLGVEDDASPRDILGLPVGPLSAPQIEAAVRARISSIMSQPNLGSDTAQTLKDIVREAAEMLLLEIARLTRIREHRTKSATTSPSHRPSNETVPSWIRSTPPIRLTPFDRQVLAVIVGSGGWNNECRMRLISLASRHAVTVHGLQRIIDGLAKYAKAGGPRLGVDQITGGEARVIDRPPTHVLSSAAEQIIPRLASVNDALPNISSGWRTVHLSLIFGVLTVVIGVITLQAVLSDSRTQSSAESNESSRSVTPLDSQELFPPEPSIEDASTAAVTPADFLTDPIFQRPAIPIEATIAADQLPLLPARLDELLRHIQVSQGELSMAALKKWDSDIRTIGNGWVLASESTRSELLQAVWLILQAAAPYPQTVESLLDSFSPKFTGNDDPDLIWRVAWCSGALAHYADVDGRYSPRSQTIAQRLRSNTKSSESRMPTSFAEGARFGLQSFTNPLIERLQSSQDVLDGWEWWIRAHSALGRGPDHERAMTAAVRGILKVPSLLSRDGLGRQVLGRLIAESNITSSAIARDAVLDWYSDDTIPSESLWVLTSLLYKRAEPPCFDVTNLVAHDSDIRHRRRLKDQLARIWIMSERHASDASGVARLQVDADLYDRWTRICDILNTRVSIDDNAHRLVLVLMYARLGEAAASLASRNDSHCKNILDSLDRILYTGEEAAVPDVARGVSLWLSGYMNRQGTVRPGQPIGLDGQWSAAFDASRNSAEDRMRWLQRLQTDPGGDLGPIDAETFVRVVFTGSPLELRSFAQSLLTTRFHSGPVIALEMIHQIRTTRGREDLSKTIEQLTSTLLPAPSDPGWPVAARRALLDHAISLRRFPTDQDSAIIDAIASELAVSYASIAHLLVNGRIETVLSSTPTAAAVELRSVWRSRAATLLVSQPVPASLDELDRRSRIRLEHADGAVQRFVALHIDNMELMAYVIAAEQPAHRSLVNELVLNASRRREAQSSILKQLIDAQQGILHLWRLRIEPAKQLALEGGLSWS